MTPGRWPPVRFQRLVGSKHGFAFQPELALRPGDLAEAERGRIPAAHHAWRGTAGAGAYADVSGICKSAASAAIATHSYVLTPGRYVGAEEAGTDRDEFEAKLARPMTNMERQFEWAES